MTKGLTNQYDKTQEQHKVHSVKAGNFKIPSLAEQIGTTGTKASGLLRSIHDKEV